MKTVAEGVETQPDWDLLCELCCECAKDILSRNRWKPMLLRIGFRIGNGLCDLKLTGASNGIK